LGDLDGVKWVSCKQVMMKMAVFWVHRPDDGGSKDLWNAGILLPDYTALQPRRQTSSYSPPREPQILLSYDDVELTGLRIVSVFLMVDFDTTGLKLWIRLQKRTYTVWGSFVIDKSNLTLYQQCLNLELNCLTHWQSKKKQALVSLLQTHQLINEWNIQYFSTGISEDSSSLGLCRSRYFLSVHYKRKWFYLLSVSSVILAANNKAVSRTSSQNILIWRDK
jgi:hypothetical protein